MRAGLVEAWAVVVRAGRFFGRHYAVIAAFGLLASVQRFLAVGGGEERFGRAGELAAGVGGEVFTAAVRLAFLAWLVVTLYRGVDVPWSQVGARIGRFVEGHVPALLASGALLILLTLVAKVVPDAIARGLDAATRPTALAWELAIKNVTVIPFVMVWLTTLGLVAVGTTRSTRTPEIGPQEADVATRGSISS